MCPPGTHCYSGHQHGWPLWAITQGNNGSFSHQGDYAYDFATYQGNSILAARGGVVVDLLESSNQQDPHVSTCTVPGNFVKIRHQDGTIGVYFHMMKNGVLVEKNQKVRRGDTIAKVGTTGCSTGPHLHFQVDSSLLGSSVRSRFEGFYSEWSDLLKTLVPSSIKKDCYVPEKSDVLFSTNKKWSD